jgi:hypothetical protein
LLCPLSSRAWIVVPSGENTTTPAITPIPTANAVTSTIRPRRANRSTT